MGAVAVQATGGPKYERTNDPRRMLTHKLLSEAIRTDWANVGVFLPARTATSIRYEKGARKAVAWNEGESEVRIYLPLRDGWYLPDGNQFAIPNGRPSNSDDPNALYLVCPQDRSFSGPLRRGGSWCDGDGERVVFAGDFNWSDASGVAIIGNSPITLLPQIDNPVLRGIGKDSLARCNPDLLRAEAARLREEAANLERNYGTSDPVIVRELQRIASSFEGFASTIEADAKALMRMSGAKPTEL